LFDEFRSSSFGRRVSRALLDFDAWVNSSLFESGQATRARWDAFTAFMDRFHVAGLRRLGVELACEGMTLGLGGAVVLLALAVPAFRDTSDDGWLKKQDLAVVFQDRYGQEVGRRGIKHDDSVPLEQFPDFLIQAVLSTEDRRFWDHWGIDPVGLLRAVSVNARSSGVVQGGSSITQQLAKNLFLSNERTLERKIKEAYLAMWLEFHLPKREILKLYLDRAYMGGGTFGVQAAAEFYFGKNIRDISLAEASMLAGLFKAPTKYAPHINLPAARARANDVLSNLVDAGYMTEGQVYAARKNPATPVDRKRESSPDWYLDFAYDEIRKLSDGGKLGSDRVLAVRTGLDTGLQAHAESTIEDMLRQYGPQYHAKQAATVVLENSGLVRAIVGGRDYGASQFNRATDAQRQPGSSFKPFVYLTALMTGKVNAKTIVVDSPVCIGNWCPHNYGGTYKGALPLVQALAHSLNTIAVKLSIIIGNGNPKLGRARIVDTARKMGLTTALPDTVSLPIGADEVKMIDMGAAFSAFSNGGKRVQPHAAVEVRNSRGDVLYRFDRDGPKPLQVIPEYKIAEMNNMLTHVVSEGTARAAALDGVSVAGKTGTTNGYKDAWFDGFTGNYVGIVWYGNDDDTPMNNMTGGALPARTWHEIMVYAHHGIDLKPPYGVPDVQPGAGATVASAGSTGDLGAPQKPATLSPRSTNVLGGIEELFSKADRRRRADIQSDDGLTQASTAAVGRAVVRSVGGRISVD
jgi:penicillin-binding protein 1A